jgi:hypothetical protein
MRYIVEGELNTPLGRRPRADGRLAERRPLVFSPSPKCSACDQREDVCLYNKVREREDALATTRDARTRRAGSALPGKSVHERNARLSILFDRRDDTDSLWRVELRFRIALSLGDVARF